MSMIGIRNGSVFIRLTSEYSLVLYVVYVVVDDNALQLETHALDHNNLLSPAFDPAE
jgi:hypothetical protein